ncbi:aldo/keto reductase [Microbacterium sp. MPKO10]|uniref:aldo/keto reductase n=1 Tax=Microbacterium sp. MPKO10 TaxID=2989818 RepID=UPI0022363A3E|nr:aldo/keto reductase [Microbacterium sp. MPKO10]MCW4457116.1 aldo/keto reductase [Microbacterium sp. MPKO10]
MNKRALRNITALTELGFGASQLGNLHRETTDEESRDAVVRAWDVGLRYFDTAPHYGLGLSERRLGAALQHYDRDSFVISTKVGRLLIDSPETAHLRDTEGFDVPASRKRLWDFSRDGILRSIDESLIRLGLDRLDIVYLHDPDEFWEQASTAGVNALIELREQNVIGAVGVGMNQAEMLSDFIDYADVDVVMVAGRLTLLDQSGLERLLPTALGRGVGVVTAGVYNSGLLSASHVGTERRFDYAPAPQGVVTRARRIEAICRAHGVSLAEAAVQYPLRHPAVSSAVLGTRSAAHVDSGVARYNADIPDGLWAELDESGLAPDPIGSLR